LNRLLLGYALGLLTLGGCATTFAWRYYAPHIPDRKITQADVGKSLADLAYAEGLLWGKAGKDGWPDLGFEECKPDPDPTPGASPGPAPRKLKCITLLDPDFYSLKEDNEKCHAELQKCQAGPEPTP
jgi:hypothetical protein